MQYNELQQKLRDFGVFTLNDIRKVDASFYRARLNDWQAKGYIKKLRRGYYMFAERIENEQHLAMIANRLYEPSYISFEMALSHFGLIPEGVYGITSATTKKTSVWKTPVGEFVYRKIKPSLMVGYTLEKFRNHTIKIAEMEKALLDYLYLNPALATEDDFAGMRFAGNEFLSRADMPKFREYLALYNNKSLSMRANLFLDFIKKNP